MAATEVRPTGVFAAIRGTSPFTRVILGIVLGIVAGLFFGERTSFLGIVGEGYIRLLQMTVLPYILVSLIGGLGRLGVATARLVGLYGGLLILMVWATVQISNMVLPLAYPDWTTASFFSAALVQPAARFDPLTLYVPSNLFFSLANTVVPAVVVFAILMGIALIAVKEKAELLAVLATVSEALMKLAGFVAKLAPFGIFAIAAAASGTLRLEDFSKLQIYFWTYLGTWVVVTFWTLPAMVAWASPLTYREVLRQAREPMVTAFATGTVLVVLPMIVERCKSILAEHTLQNDDTSAAVDVLVPTAYSFPSAGTILGLGFIMFAAWFMGSGLSAEDYPSYFLVGTLVAFGSMAVAIPFMLDFFSLPADLFELYLLGSVMTARFATALAALHGVAIALLGAFAVAGQLNVAKLLRAAAAGVGFAVVMAMSLGFVLTRAIVHEYTGEGEFIAKAPAAVWVESTVVEHPAALATEDRLRPRLSVIQDRGSLRVGYLADRLPFAHRNTNGDVVGFDLDLVQVFARDLNVTLEISRFDWSEAVAALADGRIDLLLGGIAVTPPRAREVAFSDTYLDQNIGFVVPDHRRGVFASLEAVREIDGMRIALPPERDYAADAAQTYFAADVFTLDSVRSFFRGEHGDDVAMLYSAEAGSAWTLIYPAYSVVVPQGLDLVAPSAFALPQNQPALVAYVNTWLDLSGKAGLVQRLYQYWILGEDSATASPRWSILDDVLGWGDSS